MIIEEIIRHNKSFVANKEYEKYLTSKYPDKRLAILSCMTPVSRSYCLRRWD